MNTSGGTRASVGASLGMRLVALGTVGALGYAVVYFFDPVLGEERRRRVVEAAQAALQEVVLLSQRLVAGEPPTAPAVAPAPVVESWHEPAPEPELEPKPDPDMAGTLHDKVTFFRLGDEEKLEEAPVLAPVAVIAEELPSEPRRYEPSHASAGPAPTIIAYDAGPELPPEPAPEAEPLRGAEERRSGRMLLAAAAVVAVLIAAAALGAWAVWSGGDGGTNSALPVPAGAAQAISLTSQPGARRIPVSGSGGRMVLVVTPSGRAVLIVSGLKRAPQGKAYQAWIVTGKVPHSAGLFEGGGMQLVIPLAQRVPRNSVFAITVERAGGVRAPTQAPVYTAQLS